MHRDLNFQYRAGHMLSRMASGAGNFLLTPAHHEGPDAVVLIDPRSGRLLSTHAAAEQLACTIGVEVGVEVHASVRRA